ncbi:sulfate/molybdate ABC transporter ATP-binding protein [Loigolactobacillus jiayinensis]|uniref:Sulfate/molybdate ABC transporter ATP-binding protein n=1 Tax=Loigolactobacillus jiayinensis TaxID=2486016 RepID=A0ABW1RAW5_9LACO|nr:ATP-binding cassette domain-containing protein [Loigolactobacillus jiayinensis]
MYIEFKGITKQFQQRQVLNDINFGVKEGSITALLGPSGSGKTTILRILAGLETATKGSVSVAGQVVDELAPQARGIGFGFQNYALFRYLTVYENIAFGLKTQHWPATKIKQRVTELLALTELTALAQHYPQQLSGGQKQRVAFARAIAPHPKVLLLDEPFAALDTQIRRELRSWLKQLIHRVGITSIFVTHDHEEAIETADEIVVINQGAIEQIGAPTTIYNQPTSLFVAQFIGHSSQLLSPNLQGFKLPVRQSFKAYIRPEQVQVFRQNEQPPTTGTLERAFVVNTTFSGAVVSVALKWHGQALMANRSPLQAPLHHGEAVLIFIQQALIFTDGKSELQRNLQPAAAYAL